MILFPLVWSDSGAVSPSLVHPVKLQRGSCPMFWWSFNGRCYKYVATRMSWADAELHCRSQRANLVAIHSLQEHNFVNSLIKNFDPAQQWTWIGLSDIHKEGRWMWSDGSALDFVLWRKGEPNNHKGREHCGHTNLGSELQWNDEKCPGQLAFVCASRICP
ncbi:lactose-binding lectin l-2-like [Morone saxatilis]|uniref:lactose-binding lectin l-2-like n=1 Tax=Morone saxatilis TaxID=34816 RepID=UPI0015E1EB75|nr:lactose-binding lectin l-2-like [Morone saxatilis]